MSHITVPGLFISHEHSFLAASSDGIVTLTDGSEGLIEIKNLLQNREYSIKEASMKERSFCIECKEGKMNLRRTHKYFYQIQGQMNIMNQKWCYFIVRRTNPYDIFIERVDRDKFLWETQMFPKLEAFSQTHILPELAVPRLKTTTGIRKPSVPWVCVFINLL